MTDETNHIRDRDIEERLAAERPVPRAGFRAEMRAHLLGSLRETPPRRLRLLIATYAGSGAALLVVAAIGVAGVGPLAS